MCVTCASETQIKRGTLRAVVISGGAAVAVTVVLVAHERPALLHPGEPHFGSGGVHGGIAGVVRRPPIGGPLPDVSYHVLHAECVGREHVHGARTGVPGDEDLELWLDL